MVHLSGEWEGAADHAWLRFGFWNTRGLRRGGKTTVLVDSAAELDLDLLFIAEHGLDPVSEFSLNKWLCDRGSDYRIKLAPPTGPSSGLGVLHKVAVKIVAFSRECPFHSGLLFCRAQRAGAGPISFAAVHATGTKVERAATVEAGMEKLVTMTPVDGVHDRRVLIGDFHDIPEDSNISKALVFGGWQLLDPVDARDGPTRFSADLARSSRHIDYGAGSASLVVKGRALMTMPRCGDNGSDHDLVAYTIEYEREKNTWSLSAPRELDPERSKLSAQAWQEAWAADSEMFWDSMKHDNFDADAPFTVLSDCAERLLGGSGYLRRRSTPAKPKRNAQSSSKADEDEPIYLRHLRHLRNVHDELARGGQIGYDLERLKKQWVHWRKLLLVRFPEMVNTFPPPWSTKNYSTEVVDGIIAEAEEALGNIRIARWRDKMERDKCVAAWVNRSPTAPVCRRRLGINSLSGKLSGAGGR